VIELHGASTNKFYEDAGQGIKKVLSIKVVKVESSIKEELKIMVGVVVLGVNEYVPVIERVDGVLESVRPSVILQVALLNLIVEEEESWVQVTIIPYV